MKVVMLGADRSVKEMCIRDRVVAAAGGFLEARFQSSGWQLWEESDGWQLLRSTGEGCNHKGGCEMTERAAGRKNTTQFVFAENSLDILRLFAALQIAITHYLNLTMLTYGQDGPGDGLLLGFKRALTLFPGLIILFSISGFLMGETLMRTQNRKIFAQKRILRLYPALWVNIVLTMGMLSLLPGVVSGHGQALLPWAVVQGVGMAYPPSFLQAFAIESINGTLWALMVEIQLYVLVAVVWKRCLAWKDRTRCV